MSKIIFARTAHDYHSYTDYWQLVRLAGFESVPLADVDPDNPDHTYIVTPVNGEWRDGWQNPKATFIAWLLEWYKYKPDIPGVAEFWASDQWYATQLGARFVPLGSHSDLTPARWEYESEKTWDVCFLAYGGPSRRKDAWNAFNGAELKIAPNAWPWDTPDRKTVLERSKLMVHVHQHDAFPCMAAQRVALAASAGMPLLSESMKDPAPLLDGLDYQSAAHEQLVEIALLLLKDEDRMRELAGRLHETLCKRLEFGVNVRRALGVEP